MNQTTTEREPPRMVLQCEGCGVEFYHGDEGSFCTDDGCDVCPQCGPDLLAEQRRDL